MDARLFVNDLVGANYFFFADGINSSAGFRGTLTDDGTIALVSTRSVLGSAFEEDVIPSPGLNKLVITNLPTLNNREAVPEAMAFDLAGEPLGEVTIEATITRVIIDGEEVDL